MNNFNIGDEVVLFREPHKEEWNGIGKVPIEHLKDKTLTVYSSNIRSLKFNEDGSKCNYPYQIFRSINHIKQGDKVIRIKDSLVEDWIKHDKNCPIGDESNIPIGKEFIVKSVTEDNLFLVLEDYSLIDCYFLISIFVKAEFYEPPRNYKIRILEDGL